MRCFRSLSAESGHCLITLADSFSVHLDQFEYPLTLLAQLRIQLLELVFVEGELMPVGLEQRRAAEPIVGIFYYRGDPQRCLTEHCFYIQ